MPSTRKDISPGRQASRQARNLPGGRPSCASPWRGPLVCVGQRGNAAVRRSTQASWAALMGAQQLVSGMWVGFSAWVCIVVANVCVHGARRQPCPAARSQAWAVWALWAFWVSGTNRSICPAETTLGWLLRLGSSPRKAEPYASRRLYRLERRLLANWRRGVGVLACSGGDVVTAPACLAGFLSCVPCEFTACLLSCSSLADMLETYGLRFVEWISMGRPCNIFDPYMQP